MSPQVQGRQAGLGSIDLSAGTYVRTYTRSRYSIPVYVYVRCIRAVIEQQQLALTSAHVFHQFVGGLRGQFLTS